MNRETPAGGAAKFINPMITEDIELRTDVETKNGVNGRDNELQIEVETRHGVNGKGSNNESRPNLPEEETVRLRKWLRLLFCPAVQFRGRSCSINPLNIVIFTLQLIKIVLVTIQMFNFGNDRHSFSSIVNRGHIVLRHLLLQHWDATWESLPYPPSRGDFALYNIQGVRDGINFAVSQYYNSESDATGFYVREGSDNMTIHLKYFDFPGFIDLDNSESLKVYELSVPVDNGLQLDPVHSEDGPHYTYNVSKEFEYWNLTQPFKRLLSVVLSFSIHSVRIYDETRRARCLNVLGWISFVDDTNNGQVLVDLETLTSRLECASIGYQVEDADLLEASSSVGIGVMAISCISLILTCIMVVFSTVTFVKTKRYMEINYRAFYRPVDESEHDLPFSEYLGFFKLWDYITIVADCFTLYATDWIVFRNQDASWIVETLDRYVVFLSIGSFGAWLSLLRFLKFHNKFFLLFATLYRAILDVLAYLLCVLILFLGFLTSGYVVMAPYHVKFRTPSWAAETLFSVINGDEMFATMNILEVKKTGGDWVFWFSRFYFGAYIAVFTIVVLNLLVAIFMSAYESVREYYNLTPDDRDLGPVERAIKHFLQNTQNIENSFRVSLCDILRDDRAGIGELATLRTELGKLIKVNGSDMYIFTPKTLRAFINKDIEIEAYSKSVMSFDCFCFGFPR